MRRNFPGIVKLPSGERSVAWTWEDYRYAKNLSPEYRDMEEQVQCLFWMYFAMQPGKHDECMAVLYKICTKMVTDMHYEARVSCVRSWYTEKRNVRITKSQARNKRLDACQYMQWFLCT